VEKRRQFLSALRARDVSSATRLMRVHLESVQRMLESDPDAMSVHVALERFPAKWSPVRVQKTRQIKNLEPRSDSIGTGL
jgi:hypothetical protein